MSTPPILSGFQFIEVLLETPQCTIWRALQKTLERTVLILALKPEICSNHVNRQNAFRSLRILTSLKSAIFPDVIDVLSKDNCDYIILEDANIAGLLKLLNGRRLNAEQIHRLAEQLAEGFAPLQNTTWVYGAFSPRRLFLAEDSSPVLPDVIAATSNEDLADGHHTLPLFPNDIVWLAPEQIDLDGTEIDTRADIFAVGMTLYALATGQIPFGSLAPEDVPEAKATRTIPSPCDISPNFPPELAAILSKMTQRDPNLRYSDWDEIRVDLYQARKGVMPTIHSPGTSVIAPSNPTANARAGATIRLSVKDLRAYRTRKKPPKPTSFWLFFMAAILITLILITCGLSIWVFLL